MSGTDTVPRPEAAAAPAPGARIALAGLLAAVLWLASGGALQAIRWFTDYGSITGYAIPETMPGGVWVWPWPWSLATALLGAATVGSAVAGTWLLMGRRGPFGRLPAWFAVVLAGAAAGLVIDIALVCALLPRVDLRTALGFRGPAASAAVGAYWGLIQGWVVALIAPVAPRGAPRSAPAGSGGRALPVVVLGLALLSGIAYGAVAVKGAQASSAAAAQEAAEAEGLVREEDGVLIDPSAQGEPVPESAPAETPRDPSWCAPEEATLLLGAPDAATGHRVLPIRVVNVSERPCVVEGYPDVAFADQNGHLLDVGVEHGGSFMAQDAGPLAVTLQPGEQAVSRIGWNAAPTRGALVTAAIHAAQTAGDLRGAWPLRPVLDIVEGATVAVTAWELDAGPQPG